MRSIKSDFSSITLHREKGIVIKESKRSLVREIEALFRLRNFMSVPTLVDVLSANKIILEYIDGPSAVFGNAEFSAYRELQVQSQCCIEDANIPSFSDVIRSEIEVLKDLVERSEKFGPALFSLRSLMMKAQEALPEHSSSQRVLCHGDLHEKNSINSSEGLVFVDWEDCFVGDHYLGYSVFFAGLADYFSYIKTNYPPDMFSKIAYSEILVWSLSKSLHLKDYIVYSNEDSFSEQRLAGMLAEIKTIDEVHNWLRGQ